MDAVQVMLTNRVLSLTIAGSLPCEDLGALATACRAAVMDERQWQKRAQHDFGIASAVDGSWRVACKEHVLSHFSPGALSLKDAREARVPIVKILLADAHVGKSSLLNRLCLDEFTVTCTIGIDLKVLPVLCAKKDLILQVWDMMATHWRFRPLWPSYLRSTNVVFICYDSTDRQSFMSCRDMFTEVLEHGRDDVIIGLIATKCDLVDKREVSADKGAAFAAELSSVLPSGVVQFTETSSKTGAGVEQAAAKAARHIARTPFAQAAPDAPLAPPPRRRILKELCTLM
eukprot:CAMPEP_0203958086 /NCGR_PEP_ID=MMETSP0359-20131031/89686_1 /ASSEMBLY_ACC=CAM_ASM_000338 /TAXON_ID=268821 /ORGANISM="Scrippsiella Hangoei, Strain SHTV-5" /LENGTH=286 /DNA_ID=CAMNT_0050891999 /DNA_START=108 /DNA_END=968 /DNA_ORIENTATION=+